MIKNFCLILLLLFVISDARAETGVNIFAYSRNVPAVDIYDSFGKAVNLHEFAGNFLIIVFWSKTCIPCIRELDNLDKFVKQTKNDGIKVILVSAEDDWNTAEEQKNFLTRYGATQLDFYVDRGAKLATAFGIFTSPHTVLVNEESMEIGRIRGAVEWDDEDVVEEIYRIKASY